MLPRSLCIFVCSFIVFLGNIGFCFSESESVGDGENSDDIAAYSDTIVIRPDDELTHVLQKDSGFTSVLSTERVVSPFIDTDDVLENVVGVTVNQYGGLGMFSFVSIRGSEANQVAYYINGIPLNSASSGSFNVSSIPFGFLERIEVYRGWTPPSLGQPTLGGAVNFVTKAGLEGARGHISLALGSFETYQGALSFQAGTEKNTWLFYGNHLQSRGDFDYKNTNGTPNNEADDRVVPRANAQFNTTEFMVNYLRKESDIFNLTVMSTYQVKSQGLPGSDTIQTNHTGLDENNALLEISGTFQGFFHKEHEVTLQFFNHFVNSTFSDPDGELSLLTSRSEGVTNRAGFRISYNVTPWDNNLLSTSAGYTWEKNKTDNEVRGIFVPTELKKQRVLYYMSLDNKWSFFRNAFNIRPSIHLDGALNKDLTTNDEQTFHDYDNPDKSWLCVSPQLAMQWFVSEQFIIKSSIGKYSRYPSLNELYGDRGATAGNPSLEPETGLNRDIGFLLSSNRTDNFHYVIEYAYFDKESENLLTYVQNSQYTFRPENIGSARIRGHEFYTSVKTPSLLLLSLNYTYQEAKDSSNVPYYQHNYLPNRPMHELSSNITVRIEPVSFHLNTTYQSHNYLDRANRNKVSERLVHNLSFEWENFFDRVTCILEFRNLSDNQIEDVAGYPLPGRSFNISIQYHF